MPTSQPRSLALIHTIIQMLKPKRIIDLGIGHGKTGVILRETMDIMWGRYLKKDWLTDIYGVEGCSFYANALWEYVYTDTVISDALVGLNTLPDVDLILSLDIWEHFDKEYATDVLDKCLKKSSYLMISTPKKPLPQGDVFGNPYERHKTVWSPIDFRKVPYFAFTSTMDDWVILLSGKKELPFIVRRYCNPIRQLLRDFQNAKSILGQTLRIMLDKR